MGWREKERHQYVADGVWVAVETGECGACDRRIRRGDYVQRWHGEERWAHERCRDVEEERARLERARDLVAGDLPARAEVAVALRKRDRRRKEAK